MEQFFNFLRRWRVAVLLLAAVLVTAVTVWGSLRLKLDEDIATMLPDDSSELARDLNLLQHAPFARKIMIQLASDKEDIPGLIRAMNDLGAALPTKLFHNVTSGVSNDDGAKLLAHLSRSPALLLDAADLQTIERDLNADAISVRVAANRKALLSPDSFFSKEAILDDPLEIRRLALGKMRHANAVPRMTLSDGHFISADNRHGLLLAETPIALTDFRGGEELQAAFDTATAKLPSGISAEMVCSHRYTVANARRIRADLVWVLSVSTLGLAGLFLIYLRRWQAIWVFLLPMAALAASILVVGLVFPRVSAVTMGFGSVLLGISVDFGLHVYFALQASDEEPGAVLAGLVKPLALCAVTSIAGMAVMLLSALPGQRQLAVFTITGLVTAFGLALIVLPLLLGRLYRPPVKDGRKRRRKLTGLLPRQVVSLWLILLAVCGVMTFRLEFGSDMRGLNFVPFSLRDAEQNLAKTWGDVRGRAMVFAEGANLEAALQTNDEVFRKLRPRLPDGELLSLAPILPSRQRQEEQTAAWRAFWDRHSGSTAGLLRSAGWPEKATLRFQETLGRIPEPLTPATLRDAGLGPMVDSMIVEEPGRVLVISLVPDDPELAKALADIPGAALVSQKDTGRAIAAGIGHDFRQFLLYAGIAILILVILLFRNAALAVCALVPVVTGLLGMFGVMAAFGLPLNLFNVVAAVLIIGLGVDYGIFMIHRMLYDSDGSASRAVLVSGLTTLVGFGALLLGRHPALRSIGISVTIGIAFALASAMLVVPALLRISLRRSTKVLED